MGIRLSWAVAVCLMVSAFGVARAAPHYPKNEVWLGLGGATSFENSLLNIPNDIASNPEGVLSLGFIYNLDARRAVGFYLYGAAETTPAILLQGAGGSQLAGFDLVTLNPGMRYRHTFSRRSFAPYLFAGVNLVHGTLSNDSTGENIAAGLSACVGPGASVRLGRHFMLSAEGIGSFGAASWEKSPAVNSASKKFNPSLIAGTVNLSFVWGTARPSIPVPSTPAVGDSTLTAALTRTSVTSRSGGRPSVAEIVLGEAGIVFISAAAYTGDRGGTLAGVTAATALLGSAANASAEPPSPSAIKIWLGGLLTLAAVEFALGRAGATDDALFATSAISWNLITVAASRADRKAKLRR